MDKETPITKYLATLERRQAQRERDLMFSSPTGMSPSSQSPESPKGQINIRQQLRFEDETFLQSHDQSVMAYSPPPPPSILDRQLLPLPKLPPPSTGFALSLLPNVRNKNNSGSSSTISSNALKRKRFSFEDQNEEEDHIKKICELQKLLRLTNGELVESRAMTAKLERQRMDLRTENCEKSLNYEKFMSEMRIKCRDAVEKAEVFEKDNDLKTEKLNELKDELRRQSSQHTEKILAMESKISKLHCENVELKQLFEEEKLSQTDAIKKMSANLQESEKGSDQWSLECQILKDQLALKDTQLAKYMEEIKESQSKIFKCSELKQKFDEPDSTESQLQSLKENVKKYENLYVKEQSDNAKISKQLAKLTEENGYLKGSMDKELLLEEQIVSLENDVKYLRNLSKGKAEIEVERDSMKEKLNLWVAMAQNVDSQLSSPQNFTRFLSQMQTELIQMRHENTTLNCRVDGLNRDVNRLQSEVSIAKVNENGKKEECDKLNSEVKQLTRRLTLVTKDRDGLKSLKESYEQELEGIISTALKERVDQLERLVVEYEQVINENPMTRKTCFECDKRMALVAELRSELEKAKSCQVQNASRFGDMTMSGDGNTTGIKIVAFGNNPSTLSMEARVTELCAENDKLKNRIKQLEDLSMVGPNDTVIAQGNKILEEQIRTLERRNQILSEAYDYETQQLQTALNKLFGFHIVLTREPQSQFRLRSVYGSGPEDELVFQEAENSDMMLLESPVLDHFRDDIDRYLLREGSIPAFLATVTIGFSQGQIQPSSDASQLPGSQQSSTGDSGETVTINPINPHSSRKMVEVQVAGQSDPEESEAEEEVEEEEPEEAEEHAEEDDDEDEEEGDRYSENENDEEEDDDEGRVGFLNNQQSQGSNDSPDDVVCIDSD